MKETPKQYTERILSYIGGDDAFRAQRATPAKIARLLRGLSRHRLFRRPAPGKWSIAEILAHLAEAEWVVGYRIRMILNSNGTPIQAFDQDDWARTSRYDRQNPRKSLALFRTLREANLALVRSVPPRKLRNYGMHAERGKETVAHIVRLMAGHDRNHLRQIERLRAPREK